MGGFYNIVLIIYLHVVHVIICNPRNSASGCNVVSILIIIIIIIKLPAYIMCGPLNYLHI